MPLDPFGDSETRGYLRNVLGESDAQRIRQLEHRTFGANVLPALEALRAAPRIKYRHFLDTHRTLFGSLYRWAGHDPGPSD